MRSCLLQGDILQSLLLETLVDGQLMFITREQKTAGVLLVSPSMRMLQKHTLWRSKNIASERNSKASREMITTKDVPNTKYSNSKASRVGTQGSDGLESSDTTTESVTAKRRSKSSDTTTELRRTYIHLSRSL